MNVIGRKSTSEVFSKLLNIVFILGCITLVVFVMLYFLKDYIPQESFSLRFNYGALAFELKDKVHFDASLMISGFLLGALSLVIVYLLRNIFRSFANEEVFIADNVIRLRRIGLTTMLLAAPYSFFNAVAAKGIVDYLHVQGIDVGINYTLNAGLLIAGALILMLGEIFKIATTIADENKLTI